MDFTKVVTVNTYISALSPSGKTEFVYICGKKTNSEAKLMPLCGCSVHHKCLVIFWTSAPGFSKLYCPCCLTNYFSKVVDLVPTNELLENAKTGFEKKLDENEKSVMLKKTSNRPKKDEYAISQAVTADQSELENSI